MSINTLDTSTKNTCKLTSPPPLTQAPYSSLCNADVRGEICAFLADDDLASLSKSCLTWLRSAMEDQKRQLQEYVRKEGFGARKWEQFGTVDTIPIPVKLWDVLNSQCPFWPNKKVIDTHTLFLVPRFINSKQLTLSEIEKIGKTLSIGICYEGAYNSGDPCSGDACSDDNPIRPTPTVRKKWEDKTPAKTSWILMTNFVIPNWATDPEAKAKLLIKNEYSYPSVLEAAVNLFTCYVMHKPWQYLVENTLEQGRARGPLIPEIGAMDITVTKEWHSKQILGPGKLYAVRAQNGYCGTGNEYSYHNKHRSSNICVTTMPGWEFEFKGVRPLRQFYGPDETKRCVVS